MPPTPRPKPDPKYSAGARTERAAMRNYLRRKVKKTSAVADGTSGARVLSEALDWVLKRQQRYDKRPKGLGK